jgi:hypothetical protein
VSAFAVPGVRAAPVPAAFAVASSVVVAASPPLSLWAAAVLVLSAAPLLSAGAAVPASAVAASVVFSVAEVGAAIAAVAAFLIFFALVPSPTAGGLLLLLVALRISIGGVFTEGGKKYVLKVKKRCLWNRMGWQLMDRNVGFPEILVQDAEGKKQEYRIEYTWCIQNQSEKCE